MRKRLREGRKGWQRHHTERRLSCCAIGPVRNLILVITALYLYHSLHTVQQGLVRKPVRLGDNRFFNADVLTATREPSKANNSLSSLLLSIHSFRRYETSPLYQCNNTIVTAYFNVKSKHKAESYNQWMKNFFSLQDCMVVYCDTASAPQVLKLRKSQLQKTVILQMNVSDLPIAKLGETFWRHQLQIDPERKIHQSYEVFWIWLSKSWWVFQSIAANHFSSNFFMWSDVGCFRSKSYNNKTVVKHPEVVPQDTIAWMAHHQPRFPPEPTWNDKFKQKEFYFHSGSQAAGSLKSWKAFHSAFVHVMEQFIEKGLFIGEDQCVLQGTCQSYPHMCSYLPFSEVRDNFYFGLVGTLMLWNFLRIALSLTKNPQRFALHHGGDFRWWIPSSHLL